MATATYVTSKITTVDIASGTATNLFAFNQDATTAVNSTGTVILARGSITTKGGPILITGKLNSFVTVVSCAHVHEVNLLRQLNAFGDTVLIDKSLFTYTTANSIAKTDMNHAVLFTDQRPTGTYSYQLTVELRGADITASPSGGASMKRLNLLEILR